MSTEMRNIIIGELDKIERAENVKIIMAIESGSRAWGFASPDSDYDVRFIYVRKCEDYLKLEKVRDVIEWKLDDVLDINGWDIKKALQLLHNSNPTVFEWCASPIIYKTTEEFVWLKEILPKSFSVKKSLYHYWHIADSTYRDHLTGEKVKIKKYFYVLRPLLAAKWILDKKTAPPMLFDELVATELEEEIQPEIKRLLEMKKTISEMGQGAKNPIIDDYVEKEIQKIKSVADTMENQVADWESLNALFLRMIQNRAEGIGY